MERFIDIFTPTSTPLSTPTSTGQARDKYRTSSLKCQIGTLDGTLEVTNKTTRNMIQHQALQIFEENNILYRDKLSSGSHKNIYGQIIELEQRLGRTVISPTNAHDIYLPQPEENEK